MKKIDWYILKKFLTTFFFAIFLFAVIAVAVDLSEKADDFVSSDLSTKDIILKYYIGFVPYIVALLFPLFVFIAVIFLTSRMATRSEIVAILASGISYNRFLRPYIIGGLILSGILWYASQYIIPKAQALRASFQSVYVDKFSPKSNANENYYAIYKRSDANTYVGFRYYDTLTKMASGFYLDRVKNDKVVYNLRADNLACWTRFGSSSGCQCWS